MSNNTGKGRQILIPCASSVCSSGSDGQNPLSDDYDEDLETHLYYPPSSSQFKPYNMPDRSYQSFFGHSNTQKQSRISPNASRITSAGVNVKRVVDARFGSRPTTASATNRFANYHPSTRSSTSVSFHSSSTGSDDYLINLPPTSLEHRTARGRHMNSSMSDESRTASRQSVMTTSSNYSILDTRQIHVYLKKNDSELSLSSIQTMSQLTMDDENGDDSASQVNSSRNSSARNEPQINTKDSEQSENKSSITPVNSSQSQSRAATAYTSSTRLRPEAMWRSATHSPDDDQSSYPRNSYLGELVWKVDDLVYCGGIQAAQNLNLLCRMNIEYIVDLCGEESENISRYHRPRPEYPCLCARKTAHSRLTMTINVKDDSEEPNSRMELSNSQRQDIITYFGDLINIIQKARITRKCVLIHSMKGRNRAPAFVAAYLMHSQRCTRVQALSQISVLMSKTRPGLNISDNYLRVLNHWQNLLGIKSSEGFLTNNSASVFHVKKAAWGN